MKEFWKLMRDGRERPAQPPPQAPTMTDTVEFYGKFTLGVVALWAVMLGIQTYFGGKQ
jgi:hypothetical protein